MSLIFIIVIVNLVNYIASSRSLTCSSNQILSPINIDSTKTLYYPEKYFRILNVNYNDLASTNTWTVNSTNKALEITTSNMGNVIIVKDWALYQFNLERILIRTPSEHTINGASFDLELQFIHSLHSNLTALPGRRVYIPQNSLVISILFKQTNTISPSSTMLFNFTNIVSMMNGNAGPFLRNIKIKRIINHMPSYIYEGSLTDVNCNPALWIVQSQYNYLMKTEFDTIQTIMKNKNLLDSTSSNSAGVQTLNNVQVLQNSKDPITVSNSSINYNKSNRFEVTYNFLFLISIIYYCLFLN